MSPPRSRPPADAAQFGLDFDAAPAAAPAGPPMAAPELLATLRAWSESGWLRRLDSALAAFVLDTDPAASPVVLFAVAVLAQMEGRGHTCLPLQPLVDDTTAVLGWTSPAREACQAVRDTLPATVAEWTQTLSGSHAVRVAHASADQGQPFVLAGPAHAPRLYLRRYWDHEREVARQLRERASRTWPVEAPAVQRWLDRLFGAPAAPEAGSSDEPDWQRLACAVAVRAGLAVITGGPGTGKTYTAARLLALLFALDPEPDRLRVALAAPTGKAAARLKQSIDTSLQGLAEALDGHLDLAALTQRIGAARTLHALLGARPDTRRMQHDATHPLDIDVLIVDEASMIHLEMMSALLQALPPTARLVLLGDKDQLASVEAGAVLGDLCRDAESGAYGPETVRYAAEATGQALPVRYHATAGRRPLLLAQQTVMLRQSRRFSGPIGRLALAVNAGDAMDVRAVLQSAVGGAVHANEHATTPDVLALAVHGRPGAVASYRDYLACVAVRPQPGAETHAAWVASALRAFERFRLLCAVREGDWGAIGLNRLVERALAQAGLLTPRGEWYVGRPVMVTRNDPSLGVFNGDIGLTLPPATPGGALRVWFLEGEQLRSVGVSRLAHVETAFAMTVHKSQGSEFEHTVLVLPPHGGALLNRELVYTGITRARQAFTLMAPQPGLLAAATQRPTRRASGLIDLLAPAADHLDT